jgi:hypothetical protein
MYYGPFSGILFLGSGDYIDLLYNLILRATVACQVACFAAVIAALGLRSIVLLLRFLRVVQLRVDVA